MNRFRYLLLLSAIILTATVNGQTVSGKLVDETNQPLPYANVVLLALSDSTFVSGVVSGEDGTFSLENPTQEERLLRITSIGYATVYDRCSTGDLGTLQMQPDAQMLGEVTVKADLPRTQLKGDAMITHVQGSVLEKAGTGEDLLNRIPGVSAADGGANVFGRGAAEIYINGRKVRSDSELDQLESDQVKRVEVVRNPGARYDASVKAVIRIYTRKPVGEGFGFNNRAVAQNQRVYGWTLMDQFNFNYRKGGFDLSGMLFGSRVHGGNKSRTEVDTHAEQLWHQDMDRSYERARYSNVQGSLSMNYQFNDRHSMGVRYNANKRFSSFAEMILNSDIYADGELYEHSSNYMVNRMPSMIHTLNYYYNGQAGNWNIDFNADGMWNTSEDSNRTHELINDVEENNVNTYNENVGHLYAAKLVVSHPLWEGNLSFGSECTYTNRSNLYMYVDEEGILDLDNDDSRIKEYSVSAFVDYARSFGKLNMLVGLRYEHVDFKYYEEGERIDGQSRTFDNLFPSLSFNLPVGKTQLQLSYSSGIRRPSYNQLRANVYYSNRYTYQTGNPFLKPVVMHDVQLAAAYRWINFNLDYTHTKDDILQVGETWSEENPAIMLLNLVNAKAYDNISASVTLSPTIGLWQPQFTTGVLKQWFSMPGYDGEVELDKPVPYFVWQNSFRLPGGFLLSADASYVLSGHAQNCLQNNNALGVSMSLYKEFFKGRLSAWLKVTDLFETDDLDVTVFSGIRTMTSISESRRNISLTLRYNFNVARSKYKGTGAGSSQKSRM